MTKLNRIFHSIFPVDSSRSKIPVAWLVTGLALLIVFTAAALRLHLLGAQSLWNDEGNAYVQATRTFPEIAANAARDIHPPGYYGLLAVWRVLTGESEFALRALSAFAGVLTVALTYALGKRLYSPVAGLAAAVLVALNTFNLYYSQEARMYALLGLWSAASMWALVGMMRTRNGRSYRWWGLALALFNADGLYTHYAYPAVMVVQGGLVAIWLGAELYQRFAPPVPQPSTLSPFKLLRDYILANLLTILLFLPWLPTAWTQITGWPSTGQSIPVQQALTIITGWFSLGITYQLSQTSIAFSFFLLFGLLVFPQQDGVRSWWRMLVPVLWVAITLGGFLVMGLFREANLKFLIPAQIGYALWVGRGVWILWTLKPRRTAPIFRAAPRLAAAFGMLALIVAQSSGLDALYHAPQFQRDNYRGIAALINAHPHPDDAVILNAPGQAEVFRYYYDREDNVYPLPIGLTVDTDATRAKLDEITATHRLIYAVLWGTSERDPQNLVENTLDGTTYEIDSQWFGNVRLVRYAAPQPMAVVIGSGAVFGDLIRLKSHTLSIPASGDLKSGYQPGDVLQVRLDWEMASAAPIPRRYKVFIQLLNPDGVLVAQRDSEPVGGLKPTDQWHPGEMIADNHALIIPDDLTPAHYRLIIGLYNPDNSTERLPVSEPEGSSASVDSSSAISGGDFLTLQQITVESRGE